jgi:hypothetical protein
MYNQKDPFLRQNMFSLPCQYHNKQQLKLYKEGMTLKLRR